MITMRRHSVQKIVAALVGTISIVACNRGEQAKKSGPTVALVVKTLNNAFFIEMEKGARAAADSLGIQLVVQAPEREIDVEKQMQIVENLIQRKVDVILLVPSGSREIVPAISKANAANIPVVTVDTRADAAALTAANAKIATFIGSDNVEGGRIAGEFVAEKLGGKGKLAVLEGIPGHETGDSRLKGFREAIAKHPGLTIVASQTANWERDQGFSVFRNMLQAHPDIDALFACNDMMALGAVEAIQAAGRTGRIRVIGFDAVDDARKAIAAGRMEASVAQYPEEMGRIAIESAVKRIGREPVPRDQRTKVGLITRANLDAPR